MSTIGNEKAKRLKTGINRYLSFSLGTEEYAIPLLSVKEVIALPEFTPVPYTPAYFLGLMNLRGQVISAIDFRLKLGMKAQEKTEETAVIILDLQTVFLGVVVDSVNTVLALPPEEIAAPPTIESSRATDYITGVVKIDQSLILLLDIARALNAEDLGVIRDQAGSAKSSKAS